MTVQYIISEVNRRMDAIDADEAAAYAADYAAYLAEKPRMDAIDAACDRACDPDYLGWQAEQAFYGSGEDAHDPFCECDECMPLPWYEAKMAIEQAPALTWHTQHIAPVAPLWLGPLCLDCGGPLSHDIDFTKGAIRITRDGCVSLSCVNCDMPF